MESQDKRANRVVTILVKGDKHLVSMFFRDDVLVTRAPVPSNPKLPLFAIRGHPRMKDREATFASPAKVQTGASEAARGDFGPSFPSLSH